MGIILSIVALALSVYALVTLVSTDEDNVRFMPKLVWALLIIFVPILGAGGFLLLGKSWGAANEPDDANIPDRWDHEERRRREREQQRRRPEPDDGLDDEARIEAEIRFHEEQAEIRRLEAKLKAEREARGEA